MSRWLSYCAAKLKQVHDDGSSRVALAFPDDPNHRRLLNAIRSALKLLEIHVYLVNEKRKVSGMGL